MEFSLECNSVNLRFTAHVFCRLSIDVAVQSGVQQEKAMPENVRSFFFCSVLSYWIVLPFDVVVVVVVVLRRSS